MGLLKSARKLWRSEGVFVLVAKRLKTPDGLRVYEFE